MDCIIKYNNDESGKAVSVKITPSGAEDSLCIGTENLILEKLKATYQKTEGHLLAVSQVLSGIERELYNSGCDREGKFVLEKAVNNNIRNFSRFFEQLREQ